MKIGAKLIGGFCVVAALVAVVGGTGMFGINKIGKAADTIMDREVPMADASMEGMIALISARDILGSYLLAKDVAKLNTLDKEFEETVALFDKQVEFIKKNGDAKLQAAADEADGYHAQFIENATQLMKDHRQALIDDAKMDSIMVSFDEHVAELKKIFIDYETELTRNAKIDKRVDAAMEAKTIMVEQQAIVEEYAGLTSEKKTEPLRQEFSTLMNEFDALEKFLPEQARSAHEDFCKLAMAKGGLFDQKDKILEMDRDSLEHMKLADQFSSKGDLAMDKVDNGSGENMKIAMAGADAAQSNSNLLIVLITIFALVLAIGIGVVIGRGIALPLKDTVHMIEEMEKGHLDNRLNLDRKDEIGQMANVMDRFSDSLQKEMVAALDMLANGNLTFDAKPHDEADAIRNSLKKPARI